MGHAAQGRPATLGGLCLYVDEGEVNMAIYTKPLELVEEADLQALVTSKDAEAKRIEYEEKLPGNLNSSKKEFLANVSSFANAVGGDLIFGVKADHGVPTEVCGVETQSSPVLWPCRYTYLRS